MKPSCSVIRNRHVPMLCAASVALVGLLASPAADAQTAEPQPTAQPATQPAAQPGATPMQPVLVAAPETVPYDPPATTNYLEPRPGAVPIVISSDGGPQSVSVALEPVPPQYINRPDMIRERFLCQTPCTLYIRPGTFDMITGGRHAVMAYRAVQIPQTGGNLRLHSGSHGFHSLGKGMLVVGGVIAVVGLLVLVGGLWMFNNHLPDDGTVLGVGGVITGVGALFMVPGALIMRSADGGGREVDTGVTSARLRPSPRMHWSGGLAPTANGAGMMFSLGATF